MKRKDHIFEKAFNRIGYTGSYYDRLKVGEADEYDLNLILKPKLKMEPSKVSFKQDQQGNMSESEKLQGYNIQVLKFPCRKYQFQSFINPGFKLNYKPSKDKEV